MNANLYLGEEINSAVNGAGTVVAILVGKIVGDIIVLVVDEIVGIVLINGVIAVVETIVEPNADVVFCPSPLIAAGKSVLWMEASEDGEPGVAANSHSHNHGHASSARCFILLIVSLAHRRCNSYGNVLFSFLLLPPGFYFDYLGQLLFSLALVIPCYLVRSSSFFFFFLVVPRRVFLSSSFRSLCSNHSTIFPVLFQPAAEAQEKEILQ